MNPSHDEVAELLGAYALDAVDDAERAMVVAHLPDCPRCAAEVAEHRDVAALIANTGGAAPEGVWSRIAQALDEPPSPADVPSGHGPTPRPVPLDSRPPARRPAVVWLAAVAAALVVVSGVIGATVFGASDPDGGGSEVVAPSLDDVAREVLNDERAQRVALASSDGSLAAAAVIGPDGAGYLVGTSLPALGPTSTYQLWGVRNGVVLSLGVLGHRPGVVAFRAADGLDALAITEEVAGGVSTSAKAPILTGSVG